MVSPLFLLVFLAGVSAVAAAVFLFFWWQKNAAYQQMRAEHAALQSRLAMTEQQMQERATALLATQQEMRDLDREYQEAQRQLALMRQEMAHQESQMRDWEVLKEQSLNAAKASVMAAGNQLSNKLLEDHKRELEASRKQSDEQTVKTTETLYKEFTQVVTQVTNLSQQMQGQRGTVDKLWKALSIPSEAGRFAEIGLENCFKAFGLEVGRDYLMQYATGGEDRLRPDAIVFLPQETVMVVDSKTSIFLLELAQKEGEDDAEALAALRRTMMNHLKQLSAKDYRGAVMASLRQANANTQMRRMLNVMYLPHESALERIHRADPTFLNKCMQADIIPAGPTGLAGLLALCRIEIDLARQAENQEHILQAVQELLESLSVVLGYASSVGRSLKSAADHFHSFATSVNKRLLPRSRKLAKLGVRPAKSKDLPQHISSFSVLEEGALIEGEVEEDVVLALTPSES